MKNYIYLIGILLITLGLAIANLHSAFNTLEEQLQVEFDKLENERMSQ